MADELEITTINKAGDGNVDNIPTNLVSTGYQAQNTLSEAISSGIDSISISFSGGLIIAELGGTVEDNGLLYTLKQDVTFTPPASSGDYYFVLEDSATIQSKTLSLLEIVPVWVAAKNSFYTGDGKRVLSRYIKISLSTVYVYPLVYYKQNFIDHDQDITDLTLVRESDSYWFCITSNADYVVGDTVPISECISREKYVASKRTRGGIVVTNMNTSGQPQWDLRTGLYGLTSGGEVHIYECDADRKILDSSYFYKSVINVHFSLILTGGSTRIFPALLVPYFNNNNPQGDKAEHAVLYGKITDFTSGIIDLGRTFSVSSNKVSMKNFAWEALMSF